MRGEGGGREQRLHSHGSDLPHEVLHMSAMRDQFAREAVLFARRKSVLRGGLFGA